MGAGLEPTSTGAFSLSLPGTQPYRHARGTYPRRPGCALSAVQRWNLQHADDEALAIDGKTLCHAIDDEGRQTPILGVVGHQSQTCYTQKKLARCP